MTTDSSASRSGRIARYRVLDGVVDAFEVDSLLDHIAQHVRLGALHLIAYQNINSLALLRRSAPFRAFYDAADAVFIDGMPVVWLARLAGHDVRSRHRVGVLDWIWPLAERAERQGWRILHLGGSDAMNADARAILLERHPGLQLTTLNGYFDPLPGSEGNGAVLDRIRDTAPHVILVGMGMPRQEAWVLDNLDALPPAVVIMAGGIFGYLSGHVPTAPRWIGRLGLEWLFRLASEPRRLWRRYLVEPFVLVPSIVRSVRRRR